MLRFCALAAVLAATPALAKDILVEAGPNAQERLQSALLDAKPGDTVRIGAGRFELTDGLSLDVAGVTVRGAGTDKTVLSFKGQLGAGEGLLVTSDDVVLRDFAVEDSKGDGIKSKGADRIVYKNVRVEWTGGPKASNGAYGVYPVESSDVLIDGVTVSGASDAGIYVGQSNRIIVRNSTAMYNVAGIEIENSGYAEVTNNLATHNTGGILVFDLPALPKRGAGYVLVKDNKLIDNDTPNFAPPGNTVATVPTGTGVLVMAENDVQVVANTLSGNGTANIMVVAYRQPFEDKSYDPYPRDIYIGHNKHGRAGFAPAMPGGAALAQALGGTLPPIFWDGTGGDKVNLTGVADAPVLTLNLALGAGIETAKPQIIALQEKALQKVAARILLPAAMEAAAK
ncbi:right-handed parallel beta-helix repeat-containing protein [Sphingomonas sp. R-74633]|uniref:parallel beta-helix domain-containing protein n=1 Tax=Sphingomonas sp. R-74633 TaxID=2751188 RepID=UPI0015D1A770|nr:parallel beta-helix domain-containing protein [Sphingomonas sp. R-74633]NYT41503.1 right-handed parallel beta-helix repeat-containing protein [Sphingomonas sp. R-74633]